MNDSRPFMAYYCIWKYLSPGSRGQPDTKVQRQFMAWVQRWVDDEGFKQHVEPMWCMLSKIKSEWQHKAECDNTLDISFVNKDQPLSNQWQSVGAVETAQLPSVAQPFQGQQYTTPLHAAEMQPIHADLMAVPANLAEHAVQTGDEGEHSREFDQFAKQIMDDEWQLSSSSTGQHRAQQATVQGVVQDQQGALPGQHGAVQGQQYMSLEADSGIMAEQTDAGFRDPHPRRARSIYVREHATLMHTSIAMATCSPPSLQCSAYAM